MSNNKKKTKEELKKLQEDLIRKQTDLAAFLAEKEQLEAALETELEQELREEARRNFKAFFVQAWDFIEPGKPYMDNWHIDAICEHLEAVQYGHIQNLIIAVPPRTSKSSLCSLAFPCWSWLQDPSERFITVAAVEKLVIRDAVRSRRLIQSPWYQGFKPPFELQKDVNQKSRYENTASGYRIAVSVGASAIGEGFSILICLPFEEEIDTNLGSLRIGEIVEKEIKCKVKTFNHDTNKVEWLDIDRYEKNPRGNRAIYEVETASGIKFRATEDHPIYCVNAEKYIELRNLKVGDFLLENLESVKVKSISKVEVAPEYVYNIATGNHNYFCRGVLIHNCDDLTRPSDVKSKAEMDNILEFWTQTLATRKNSVNARRILLQQRLATNDPIGYELAHNEELWDVLKLPMEYDSSDKKYITSLGWSDPRKKDGEVLWPERFPPAELKNLKKQLGVYGTAAQLQQNPVPLEGGIIKREWIVKNYYNNQDQFNRFSLNQFDLIIGSWDLTFSNTGDSWNVGIVVGKKGSDKYILDMWRGRYDIIQQRDAIREMYAKYPQIRAMLIEKKANGEAVQRVLRREIPGILLIDPREIGAGDKEARLSACAIDFEANNVKFPHPSLPGCSWVELAIDELTLFPKTPNDDIVDAVSMALNWLASKSNIKMAVANTTNFFSNNQEKAKFEGKVAPSKEELNQDGSFLQNQVDIPTFNISGLKSYKNIFN